MQTSSHDFISYYNLSRTAIEISPVSRKYEKLTRTMTKKLIVPYTDMLRNFDTGLKYQFEIVEWKFQQ